MSDANASFGQNWRSAQTGTGSMYAITCDLDASTLEQIYGSASWRNAYTDIRNVLDEFGFERQQGSVYFGNADIDAVTCVLAVQDLSARFTWFSSSVRDIRMLRIEDNNDLRPAIDRLTRRRK